MKTKLLISIAVAFIAAALFIIIYSYSIQTPLTSVACLSQNRVNGYFTWEIATQGCYRIDDVLNLSRALNLSDTISILGVLLAFFTLVFPVSVFIVFSKTFEENDKKMETLEGKLLSKKEENNKALEVLKNEITLKANFISKIIAKIELFKIVYAGSSSTQIASELLSLVDSTDESCQDSFLNLESHILEEDVKEVEAYVQVVKEVLDILYDANSFDTDEKKRLLNNFLQGKLKSKEHLE
ncbi:MAG: hypothetical protein FE834_00725 [Gammaproteobacteria bacterium]|nr:hypothetical protein [Gammaproteobacteria bacterium]